MLQYISIIQPLMKAEPIPMGNWLKLNLWCKVCVHSSVTISKKHVQADKQRKSGNDSLTNEIRWCISSKRCFENGKKQQEGMGERSNNFMDLCCCISISYLWSTCLYCSEFWLEAIKYTRLHRANFICWFLNSTSRAQDMNECDGWEGK